MEIKKQTISGSVESGDILITLNPSSNGIVINLQSKFIKQFGEEIKKIINETLISYDVKNIEVLAQDQGALPAVIKARVISALERQGE